MPPITYGAVPRTMASPELVSPRFRRGTWSRRAASLPRSASSQSRPSAVARSCRRHPRVVGKSGEVAEPGHIGAAGGVDSDRRPYRGLRRGRWSRRGSSPSGQLRDESVVERAVEGRVEGACAWWGSPATRPRSRRRCPSRRVRSRSSVDVRCRPGRSSRRGRAGRVQLRHEARRRRRLRSCRRRRAVVGKSNESVHPVR